MANFGKIGFTSLQSKTALCRLFSSRVYDSNMMYRVVKKAMDLHYGDATDYVLKLVELGKYHSSKGGLFEMASDRSGRLEILHWSGSFSSLFVEMYNDFVRIGGKKIFMILVCLLQLQLIPWVYQFLLVLWLLLQKIHHQSRVILII